MTDVRRQRTDDRCQKTDERGQMSEDRKQRTDDRFKKELGFRRSAGGGSAQPLAAEAASLIESESSSEPKQKYQDVTFSDFECGSGFQPRLTRSGRYA